MRADLWTYLSENCLAKVDRASMAHGLEVRVPLLGNRVVDFALSQPAERAPAAGDRRRCCARWRGRSCRAKCGTGRSTASRCRCRRTSTAPGASFAKHASPVREKHRALSARRCNPDALAQRARRAAAHAGSPTPSSSCSCGWSAPAAVNPRSWSIRRDNIGDLVCATPLFAALRRRYPDATFAALVNSYNAGVLAGNPDVNAVHAYTKLKHRSPASRWLGTYWRAGAACSAARASVRLRDPRQVGLRPPRPGARAPRPAQRNIIGFAAERARRPRPHEVEVLMQLAAALDVTDQPGPLRVFPDPTRVSQWRARLPSGVTRWVAVHISAREPGRIWPARTVSSASFEASNSDVVLLWAPGPRTTRRHPGDDARAAAIPPRAVHVTLVPAKTESLEDLIAVLSLVLRLHRPRWRRHAHRRGPWAADRRAVREPARTRSATGTRGRCLTRWSRPIPATSPTSRSTAWCRHGGGSPPACYDSPHRGGVERGRFLSASLFSHTVALRLILLLLGSGFAVVAITRNRHDIRLLPQIWLPFLLWAAWAVLSLLWSVEPERTLKELRNEVLLHGFRALGLLHRRAGSQAARIFLPVVAVAAAAVVAIALREFSLGWERYLVGPHGGPGDHSSALLTLMPCILMAGWFSRRPAGRQSFRLPRGAWRYWCSSAPTSRKTGPSGWASLWILRSSAFSCSRATGGPDAQPGGCARASPLAW